MARPLRWLTLAFLLLTSASLASAETFLVTSHLDIGPNTLRAAIAASNTTTGVQTIAFAVSNSITVDSTITVSDPVVVEGGGTTLGGLGAGIGFPHSRVKATWWAVVLRFLVLSHPWCPTG